jgi:PKD repeat protein
MKAAASAPFATAPAVGPCVALAAALVFGSCRADGASPAGDAAAPPVDARGDTDAAGRDASGAVLAVDFTVLDCPGFNGNAQTCKARAPLTVTFVPVSSSTVKRFRWDFGDGSERAPERNDRMPTHVYALPGTYDVSVLGIGADEAAGTVAKQRQGYIDVVANETGQPCDVDAQCTSGLVCVCGSASPCGPAFPRGICAGACAGGCAAGSSCAHPGLGARPEAAAPWQRPRCLQSCASDGDCAAGQRCQDLPDGNVAGAWTRVCFPAVVAPIGAPCRGPTGALRDEACASGVCADLGSTGRCTASCRQTTCPAGSTCAELRDGRHLCVEVCATADACTDDPLLACQAPDGAGPFGFLVREHLAGVTYCTPKRCTSAAECGPAGVCRADQQGAQCVRRP